MRDTGFGVAGGEGVLAHGEELRRTLRQLRSLEIATPLQMEVIEKLVEGRRNLPELVELIYHESTGDAGYKPHYMKVKRAAEHLKSRGLVSTNLFGKNKPYRLTRYAVEMLTPIAGEPVRYRLFPAKDALSYLSTILFLIITVFISRNPVIDPSIILVMGWACCVFIGISLCRFLEMVRRVF
jgi:hypothetical protein